MLDIFIFHWLFMSWCNMNSWIVFIQINFLVENDITKITLKFMLTKVFFFKELQNFRKMLILITKPVGPNKEVLIFEWDQKQDKPVSWLITKNSKFDPYLVPPFATFSDSSADRFHRWDQACRFNWISITNFGRLNFMWHSIFKVSSILFQSNFSGA